MLNIGYPGSKSGKKYAGFHRHCAQVLASEYDIRSVVDTYAGTGILGYRMLRLIAETYPAFRQAPAMRLVYGERFTPLRCLLLLAREREHQKEAIAIANAYSRNITRFLAFDDKLAKRCFQQKFLPYLADPKSADDIIERAGWYIALSNHSFNRKVITVDGDSRLGNNWRKSPYTEELKVSDIWRDTLNCGAILTTPCYEDALLWADELSLVTIDPPYAQPRGDDSRKVHRQYPFHAPRSSSTLKLAIEPVFEAMSRKVAAIICYNYNYQDLHMQFRRCCEIHGYKRVFTHFFANNRSPDSLRGRKTHGKRVYATERPPVEAGWLFIRA